MAEAQISYNPRFIVITLLLSLSAGLVWLTFEHYPQFQYFGAAILKVGISVLLFWIIDRFLFHEIDTIHELKRGNVAYAILILGYCIIVGLAISTA